MGNVLWALAGGDLSAGCCDDRALGMHVTPGGDVYITGNFWYAFFMGSCPNPGGNADNSSLVEPRGVKSHYFGEDLESLRLQLQIQ